MKFMQYTVTKPEASICGIACTGILLDRQPKGFECQSSEVNCKAKQLEVPQCPIADDANG